jgi:HAD superfamily hydrolase (TIGR01509 family)
MIKALIFDFDGAILDTEHPEFEGWQQVYREHGAELSLAEWQQGVGAIGVFDPVAALQRRIGQTLDAQHVRNRAHALYMPVIHQQTPRPGVLEAFEAASAQGLMLAVASSSAHVWVDAHLTRLKLTEHFEVVRCRDDVAPGRAKPHPDIYLAALDALGIHASEALAIEDSLNGLRAAKAAGIFTVVTPNPVTSGLDFSQADLLLPSLEGFSLARML